MVHDGHINPTTQSGVIMTTIETSTRIIDTITRVNNSVNGNPRYRFTFDDGKSEATSSSDASFCYAVGNPGMRAGSKVKMTFTRAGYISRMEPTTRRNEI